MKTITLFVYHTVFWKHTFFKNYFKLFSEYLKTVFTQNEMTWKQMFVFEQLILSYFWKHEWKMKIENIKNENNIKQAQSYPHLIIHFIRLNCFTKSWYINRSHVRKTFISHVLTEMNIFVKYVEDYEVYTSSKYPQCSNKT